MSPDPSLPAAGARYSEMGVTQLTITVARRSDGRAVWSGSAVTVRPSDTASGSVEAVAMTLASAVMAQCPNQVADSVSVP